MPKLNPDLRKRLEARIRDGQADLRIARELHVARGTVARHRHRLLAEDPEGPVAYALKDAIRDHWRRLSQIAEQRAELKLPGYTDIAEGLFTNSSTSENWTPSLDLPGPAGILLRALREHLRQDPRGRYFRAWEEAARILASAIDRAVEWVRTGSESLNAGVEVTPFFAPAVVELCWRRERLEQRMREHTGGGVYWALTIGGPDLALVQSKEALRDVEDHLQTLLEGLPLTPEGKALLQAWDIASDRTKRLREVLWELGVMDGYPGQCRICPLAFPKRRR